MKGTCHHMLLRHTAKGVSISNKCKSESTIPKLRSHGQNNSTFNIFFRNLGQQTILWLIVWFIFNLIIPTDPFTTLKLQNSLYDDS